jgi:SPP1 gp7 family putative phage head morphogenesis protein
MRGYAQLEADVARATIAAPLDLAGTAVRLGVSLPKNYLASIAKLPIQGLTLGEWFTAQAETMSRESRRIIQQGLIEGKGTMEISRRLLAGERAAGPVLSRRSISEARLISRTTVNAVQNDAAMASNTILPESVSDSYRLLVVRDSRTSTICAALADRVFRYDDPDRKVPPFHLNCRTGVQPIIKGVDVGVTEQKTGPMNFRSYDTWLGNQSNAVQNDILGAGRADIWRNGKASLADLIDADNRVLSLRELRDRLGLGAMAGT